MRLIIRQRQQGKTSELIRLSASLPYCNYIVVLNYDRARQVDILAREMGVNIQFPITLAELQKSTFMGKNIRGFLFDDADDLLRAMCRGVPIVALTMTKKIDRPAPGTE